MPPFETVSTSITISWRGLFHVASSRKYPHEPENVWQVSHAGYLTPSFSGHFGSLTCSGVCTSPRTPLPRRSFTTMPGCSSRVSFMSSTPRQSSVTLNVSLNDESSKAVKSYQRMSTLP